jgi:hypothetical protein
MFAPPNGGGDEEWAFETDAVSWESRTEEVDA